MRLFVPAVFTRFFSVCEVHVCSRLINASDVGEHTIGKMGIFRHFVALLLLEIWEEI